MTAQPGGAARGAGRTKISAKALERVATAATAEALGVEPAAVQVSLTDRDGQLDLAARTAIRVVSIARALEEPRAITRSGGTILERCTEAEHVVRDRVQQVTGHSVRHVTVRLNGVRVAQDRRVQ